MHYGHIEFINQSKNRCDVLFVGVYSDVVSKIIKGEERPFIDEIGRFALVESNRNIDYIVEINSLDSCSIIELIKPNIYITTEDHSNPKETKAVVDNGGKVDVVSEIKGYNTTKLIMNIANSRKNIKTNPKNTGKQDVLSIKKGVYVPSALTEEEIPEIRL
jgi:D-beta-D-heptose 7-phosphate kinase/D-beta-D-heptose 1-phosphate adenosyltransferase